MAGTKRSGAKRVTAKRSGAKRAAKPRTTKRGSVKHHGDEQAIRDLDTAWSEAAGKMDLERVVGFYAPDGSVVWPDHPAAHGTAAIRSRWAERQTDYRYVSLMTSSPIVFLSAARRRRSCQINRRKRPTRPRCLCSSGSTGNTSIRSCIPTSNILTSSARCGISVVRILTARS
jgi:SnoaL-like domain